MAFLDKLVVEAGDHLVTVEAELEESLIEVEQIAVRVALEQRPKLGAEDCPHSPQQVVYPTISYVHPGRWSE
jgi:hypothetical protein